MTVRPVHSDEADRWLRLRCELWPDGSEADHSTEIARYFEGTFPRTPWMVMVAQSDDNEIVGLVELGLREYAEGCATTPVAYVEGIYVTSEYRRKGIAGSLLSAAEAWGREQGCKELASDCHTSNDISREVHLSFEFEEAGTIICFRKSLL